jgi:hypothetical protein
MALSLVNRLSSCQAAGILAAAHSASTYSTTKLSEVKQV